MELWSLRKEIVSPAGNPESQYISPVDCVSQGKCYVPQAVQESWDSVYLPPAQEILDLIASPIRSGLLGAHLSLAHYFWNVKGQTGFL